MALDTGASVTHPSSIKCESRKRQIGNVADIERSPDATRLRLSAEATFHLFSKEEDEGPSHKSEGGCPALSDSESDFTNIDDDAWNGGVQGIQISDVSFVHGGGANMQKKIPTHNENEEKTRIPSAGVVSAASRTTPLHTPPQSNDKMFEKFAESDDACLLAAVEEVRAKMRKEKWQLVSEAMARRGAITASKGAIRRRYKELVGTVAKSAARKSLQRNTAEQCANKDTSAACEVANDNVTHKYAMEMSSSHQTKVMAASDGLGHHKSTGEALERNEISPRINMSTISAILKTDSINPGSPLGTANSLENSHYESRTSADSTGLPKAVSTASEPAHPHVTETREGSNASTVASQTDNYKCAPSRVGSATNRGPARLTSWAMYDNARRRSQNAQNSRTDPAQPSHGLDTLAKGSPDANAESFKAAVDSDKRIAQQQSVPPPPERLQPGSSQQQVCPPQLPSLPTATFSQKPLPLQADVSLKPFPHQPLLEVQASQDGHIAHQYDSVQSTGVIPQNKSSTPLSIMYNPAAGPRSPGRPKIPLTRKNVKAMIRHRNLNEVNRRKRWDIVAQECGVTATFVEISKAFEEAGFYGILGNWAGSPGSTNPAPQPTSTDVKPYSAPRDTTPSPSTMTATECSSTMVSEPPAPVYEFPAPTGTPHTEGTPVSPAKRRRGRPRRDSLERLSTAAMSPSQPKHHDSEARTSNHSSAMKAAWARRKEREAKGIFGGQSRSSTVPKDSTDGKSAAIFAAQVLAAADAQTHASPSPAPQAKEVEAAVAKYGTQVDEPVDLLTGKSMFTQHQHDQAPVQSQVLPKIKKIVRRSYSSLAL